MLLAAPLAFGQQAPTAPTPTPNPASLERPPTPIPPVKQSETEHEITLGGKSIRYKAAAGNLLIKGDDADRSIDYVYNDPDLSAPVIRGRYVPGKTDLAKVHAAFPSRALFVYHVKAQRLEKIGARGGG